MSQHDFRVLRKYLAVETVQCSRCTMLYVRDAETKKPIPAQVQEFLLDAYPNCDEFSDLTTVDTTFDVAFETMRDHPGDGNMSWLAEYRRKQELLVCKGRMGVVSIQTPPQPGGGYEYVEKEDGTHLMMNERTHDFGLVVDRANSMADAISKAQNWRAVVSVMES